MDAPAKKSRSDHLEDLLDNWARWMDGGGKPRGCPNKASGGLVGYTIYTGDMDTAYAYLDGRLGSAVDAAINGLAPAERAAIYHAYGVASVFRFPRNNYDQLLATAKQRIAAALIRRGVWLGD